MNVYFICISYSYCSASSSSYFEKNIYYNKFSHSWDKFFFHQSTTLFFVFLNLLKEDSKMNQQVNLKSFFTCDVLIFIYIYCIFSPVHFRPKKLCLKLFQTENDVFY